MATPPLAPLSQKPWDRTRLGKGENCPSAGLRNGAQPQHNAYIERYNRTICYEWLNQYTINSIEEAEYFSLQWSCS